MPYGFPSGNELRRTILQSLDYDTVPVGTRNFRHFLTEAGFSEKEIAEFATDLLQADNLSVDVFLERRPKFTNIGKVAIAAALLPFEANSLKTIFKPWVCDPQVGERASRGWYQYFATQLNLSFKEWGRGLLTIITYNYDRSLEHYLFTILCNSCDHPPEMCWKRFQEIPIIHLHGELDTYQPLEPKALCYGQPLNVESAKQAAAKIKIIHEVQADERFEQAQNVLNEAEVVCFLGFGYARENMARLKWTERRNLDRPKTIGGTVYKLTKAEQRRLQLERYFNVSPDVSADWDILEFLRQSGILG
jgi:hypothetical protein